MDLTTSPPQIVQTTRETIPWGVDFAARLNPGETASLPTSALVDLSAGQAMVTLIDPPTILGSVVVQIIRGSALIAGHSYRLDTGVTITASSNIQWASTTLSVPT